MRFQRGTINVGLKETIKQDVIASGYSRFKREEELEDIELLRYAASRGKTGWFNYLIANCDFYGKRGARIRYKYRLASSKNLGSRIKRGFPVIWRG